MAEIPPRIKRAERAELEAMRSGKTHKEAEGVERKVLKGQKGRPVPPRRYGR